MEIIQTGQAGSLESQDILITIEKAESQNGLTIEIDSPSKIQYGSRIHKEIESVAKNLGLESAHIMAVDKGALRFTIKARTETAIKRACQQSDSKII